MRVAQILFFFPALVSVWVWWDLYFMLDTHLVPDRGAHTTALSMYVVAPPSCSDHVQQASCLWEASARRWLWAAQGNGCLPGELGPQCLLQVHCCCLQWSKRETHFLTFHYFLFWKTTLERHFLWQIEYLHNWFPPLFFFLQFSLYSAFVKDFNYSLRTLSAEN